MLLCDYIRMIGDKAAAGQLNISERTARAYRSKERMPTPQRAKRLVKELKRVPVSFEEMFACDAEVI